MPLGLKNLVNGGKLITSVGSKRNADLTKTRNIYKYIHMMLKDDEMLLVYCWRFMMRLWLLHDDDKWCNEQCL